MYPLDAVSLKKFSHDDLELVEANFSVAVSIDLFHYFIPCLKANSLANSERLSDLVDRYRATIILVVYAERLMQLLVLQHLISADRGSYELGELNLAVLVDIDELEDTVYFALSELRAEELRVTDKQLLVLQLTVLVRIELREYLLELGDLLLARHILYHHSHGRLL